MVLWLSRFKPGGKKRTHLLLSAFLWSAVGIMLLAKGVGKIDKVTGVQLLLISGALTAGFAKSFLILDKAATRTIDRILMFKDGTCLGAIYSIKTWGLVACMMVMGIVLRKSFLPSMLLCVFYITIGWSLLFSSRLPWSAWLKGQQQGDK